MPQQRNLTQMGFLPRFSCSIAKSPSTVYYCRGAFLLGGAACYDLMASAEIVRLLSRRIAIISRLTLMAWKLPLAPNQ